jgi:hypothetical protein
MHPWRSWVADLAPHPTVRGTPRGREAGCHGQPVIGTEQQAGNPIRTRLQSIEKPQRCCACAAIGLGPRARNELGACSASPSWALGPTGDPGGPAAQDRSIEFGRAPGIGHMQHRADLARCSGLRDRPPVPLRPLGPLGPPTRQGWPHRIHGLPRDPIDLGGPMCPMGPEGWRGSNTGLVNLTTVKPSHPQLYTRPGSRWLFRLRTPHQTRCSAARF